MADAIRILRQTADDLLRWFHERYEPMGNAFLEPERNESAVNAALEAQKVAASELATMLRNDSPLGEVIPWFQVNYPAVYLSIR